MELIQRNHCVFTGQKDLELLYSFKNFPVFMGCVTHPPAQDLITDMNWWISRKSGSIQLNPLIPLETLYKQGHGSGSVGGTWAKHHKAFAEFIAKTKHNKILEIGGGHGIIAKNYLDIERNSLWIMIEPNPTNLEHPRIQVRKEFFDKNFQIDAPIDTIVHSHLLEHVYNPVAFFNQIKMLLPKDGSMVFSVPNLRVMLERGYTNCINFEHTIFLTEPYIEYSLSAAGFVLEDKQYFMDDHSIFFTAQKKENVSIKSLPEGLYEDNKMRFNNYILTHNTLIININNKMAHTEDPVYLFGAHIFSQYLIAFGLDLARIVCILDNDHKKQGKRLYGTSLQVETPHILKDIPRASIILRAGAFQSEIKNDILENINPNITFWE